MASHSTAGHGDGADIALRSTTGSFSTMRGRATRCGGPRSRDGPHDARAHRCRGAPGAPADAESYTKAQHDADIVVCPAPDSRSKEGDPGLDHARWRRGPGRALVINFASDLVRRIPPRPRLESSALLCHDARAPLGRQGAARRGGDAHEDAPLFRAEPRRPLRMDRCCAAGRHGPRLLCGLLTTLAGGAGPWEAPLHLAIPTWPRTLHARAPKAWIATPTVQLLRYLLTSETADSTVFASARDADDEQAAQEQQNGLQARLRAVIDARKQR